MIIASTKDLYIFVWIYLLHIESNLEKKKQNEFSLEIWSVHENQIAPVETLWIVYGLYVLFVCLFARWKEKENETKTDRINWRLKPF